MAITLHETMYAKTMRFYPDVISAPADDKKEKERTRSIRFSARLCALS